MQTTTMTSKGQVTIPKEVRVKLGLRQGTQVAFVVEGDHAVLRSALPQRAAPKSGFGMVKVTGPDLPPDFDAASLLKQKAPAAQAAKRSARR
jgi:AbrB family looped-hinge helix DNA binding protein